MSSGHKDSRRAFQVERLILFSDDTLTPEITHAAKTPAVVISSILALTIPVAFVNVYVARYVPLLIPIVFGIVNRKKSKRK